MLLYPEIPEWRRGLAIASCYAAAVPLGLWCYHLLLPVRRWGRAGRFVAQFASWWVAVAAGLLAAVWVGGLWVFAGRARGGGWLTDPMSRGQLLVIATVMAFGYSFFGLFARLETPAPPPAPRDRRPPKRKPFRARRRRRGT